MKRVKGLGGEAYCGEAKVSKGYIILKLSQNTLNVPM